MQGRNKKIIYSILIVLAVVSYLVLTSSNWSQGSRLAYFRNFCGLYFGVFIKRCTASNISNHYDGGIDDIPGNAGDDGLRRIW